MKKAALILLSLVIFTLHAYAQPIKDLNTKTKGITTLEGLTRLKKIFASRDLDSLDYLLTSIGFSRNTTMDIQNYKSPSITFNFTYNPQHSDWKLEARNIRKAASLMSATFESNSEFLLKDLIYELKYDENYYLKDENVEKGEYFYHSVLMDLEIYVSFKDRIVILS